MGGSFSYFQRAMAPQYSPEEITEDQVMQAAKMGYRENTKANPFGSMFGQPSLGGQGLRDAYKNELLRQLRDGSFQDGYGVYQQVLSRPGYESLLKGYTPQQDQQIQEQAIQESQ